MNDMSPTPEPGTAIALVLPAAAELEAMLKTENGMDATLVALKASALSKVAGADVNTVKGRELMKSAAHSLSKSKVEIVKRGKELTEQARKEVAAVNAGIKTVEVFLDAARDEIKRPSVDWEAADQARKDRIAAALNDLRNHGMTAEAGSAAIAAKILEIDALVIGEDFGDQREQAEMVRETAVRDLRNLLAAAEKTEADARELEELRALRAEAQAAETARLAKEAEEQAKREADAKAEADRKAAEDRARLEAENAARAKDEAERNAAAELATRAANARAHIDNLGKDTEKTLPVLIHLLETDLVSRIDALGEHAEAIHQLRLITLENVKARAQIAEQARKDAEAQAQREAADVAQKRAEQAAADAAQRERDRIATEQKAADEARAKREADQAHLAKIKADIAAALSTTAGAASPEQIADDLMAGKIPHVKVMV